jgi:hypothetical protein
MTMKIVVVSSEEDLLVKKTRKTAARAVWFNN